MRKFYFSVLEGLIFSCLIVSTNAFSSDSAWQSHLKSDYFGASEIIEDESIMTIDSPVRAENGAIVPIRLNAQIEQSDALYIKTVTLVIDNNPEPLAGIFHFTSFKGKADLALRVRLNAYSNVRVIAETSDGKLHMSKRFVKASGGCSAPIGTNLEAAFKRMGKMKFKISPEADYNQSKQLQIAISHPNVTGMQMDQQTRMYAPAHYVRKVRITYNNVAIFWAETGISISENPNFIFYFRPKQKGKLVAHVQDSKGLEFTKTLNL